MTKTTITVIVDTDTASVIPAVIAHLKASIGTLLMVNEVEVAATQGVTAAPQEGACLQDSGKSETQTDLSLTETPQPLAPPPGWKLVPIEPTKEMLFAAQDNCDILPPRGKRVWAQFLATAPQPSAGQQDRGEVTQLLTAEETKSLQELAEAVWGDLQKNQLGGYSGINRPFYLVWMFKTIIERYGYRDVGLRHSKNALDEAFERGRNSAALPPPGRGMVPMTEPVGYVNGDELDNMLDDRTATIQSAPSGFRKTPLYRGRA